MPFHCVNVGGSPGYQAHMQRHHILPCQVLTRAGLNVMLGRLGEAEVGFHDFRRNGLLLPATEAAAQRVLMPLHRGPHRQYNQLVLERIGQIEAGWQRRRGANDMAADREALMRLDLLQRALRRRLLDPRRWGGMPLNRRDPAVDFSHLDAMAEMLWADTEA
ncbi:AHH domain-containing protein [Novosphingobium capsulatum]|uniref:AHH domain-containing protein n=1 Tax=Novosphingobium capsulatum TaxID=13688 RepID=UPI00286CBE27|nr:AHH domain-containing protein [Novosphingobium capsulatum]